MDNRQDYSLLRIALGFLLAPLSPALLSMLFALLFHPLVMGVPKLHSILNMVVFSPIVTFPVAIVLGIPLFIMFRRRGWTKIWQVMLGTVTIALFVAFILANVIGIRSSDGPVNSFLFIAALFVPNGALIGWSFWILALRNWKPKVTPERTPPENGTVVERIESNAKGLFGILGAIIALLTAWISALCALEVALNLSWGILSISILPFTIFAAAAFCTYGLFVLALRMLTGRWRPKDGFLIGPTVIRLMCVAAGVLGGLMVYIGFMESHWKIFSQGAVWLVAVQIGFTVANKREHLVS